MGNRTKYKNIFILLGIIIIIVGIITALRFKASTDVVSDLQGAKKINKEYLTKIKNDKNIIESKDSIIISLKQKYNILNGSFKDSLENLQMEYASKTIKNSLNKNSTYWYVYFETSKIRGYDIIKLKSIWNLNEALELIKIESSLKNNDFIGVQSRWQTSEWDYKLYTKSKDK